MSYLADNVGRHSICDLGLLIMATPQYPLSTLLHPPSLLYRRSAK